MPSIQIRDDAIWAKNIESGPQLRERIMKLKAGETLDLEIDGIVGRWERMRDGRDGRPTYGIKPVAEMREIWSRMQKRRGEFVPVREVVSADSYLAALAPSLSEWETPEDEEAYRDL